MIHYTECPSCGNKDISQQFIVKDFSVSGDLFPVIECHQCELFFTQDIPSENEIGRFYQSEQYISHTDTSKGIINRLYHLVRSKTLKSKRSLIEKVSGIKSGKILDIGSGTGSFLHTMRSAGWEIQGIEPDEVARKNAETLHNIQALTSENVGGLPAESFDVITMWHVLEHVHQLDNQIEELGRLLKATGKIFIAVPNHTSYDATHYKEYWAAWDVPRHLYHFSPNSMEFLCKKYSLRIISMKPMWYDSFYVSMLSEKYKTGTSNYIKAVVVGAVSNLKALFNKKKCSSLIYVIEKSN